MKPKNPYILEGNITKGVITLATPVIFAMFFTSLLNIVDAFWVGKISAEAVAAISVSWPIIFIVIATSAGISTGASALVARFVGAQDLQQASKVAKNSILLGAVLSVILMAIGLFFNQSLFKFIGATGEVFDQAVVYSQIFFYGTIFSVLIFTLGAVLRGEGDTKTPMYIGIGINIFNMVLDPIFIFTFGWGVAGAAWATTLANLLGAVMYLAHFWSGKSLVPLVFNKLEYSQKFINEILFIGVPAALRNMTNAIGVFFTIKIIASYGPAVIAAYGIAFRIESFGVLPVVAIATAAVTMVGQNLGAENLKRAKHSGWVGAYIGTVIMVVFGIIVWVFAEPIVRIFNSEPDVVLYGTEVLKIKAPAFLFSALIMTLSSAFAAFGKSHYGFIVTVFRVGSMIGMAYWFNSIWGFVGVWWAIVLSGALSALFNVIWYSLYHPRIALKKV